ncbi:SIMPL domain-containing protein [Chloroflexota bacterium]
MKKSWLLAVSVVLVLALVGLAGCSPGNTVLGEIKELNLSSQQAGIWVAGEGKVTAVPDIATLRLGIEAQEASVAEAQFKASEAMDSVRTALTENGVDKKDIQTQQFSIRQVTNWDREKEEEVVVGYRVTNMVAVKIRDIDKTGSIIDAVAEAGGDFVRIDSIGFSVDDPSTYYEEARGKAMADAKAKATQLTKLAGVTLGKPTYISENIQVPSTYPRVIMEMAVPAPAPAAIETSISPGELEIILTIQVAYAILE